MSYEKIATGEASERNCSGTARYVPRIFMDGLKRTTNISTPDTRHHSVYIAFWAHLTSYQMGTRFIAINNRTFFLESKNNVELNT
jgi:hypothetical protein